MAVLRVKPEKVVALTIPVMAKQLLSPYFVTRVSGDQFKGAKGDSVVIKVPGLKARVRDYEWRTRTAPIVLDDISGGHEFAFKLNNHIYSATGLADEHFTMDEIELGTEVITPQAVAIGDEMETRTVTKFRQLSFHDDLVIEVDLDVDPHLVATEAKRRLDGKKRAPYDGRVFLVGSDVAAAWLTSERLSTTTLIGEQVPLAVRNATIGNLAGAPVVVHPELNPREAYYIHKSSLFIASVAPANPRGAAYSASRTERGFGMRVLQDYDSNFLRDRVVTSMFWGFNELRDEVAADGKWMPEVGEMDEDELAAAAGTLSLNGGSPWAVGTRKNVRVVKIDFGAGDGSVLPAA